MEFSACALISCIQILSTERISVIEIPIKMPGQKEHSNRLANCCENIREKILIIQALISQPHIIAMEQLSALCQTVTTVDIIDTIQKCDNTINEMRNLLKAEEKRRSLHSQLETMENASATKIAIKNSTMERRRQEYRISP